MEEQIKYILGIDFGHGETTAAIYCIKDGHLYDAIIAGNDIIKKSVMIKAQEGKWIISPHNNAIKGTVNNVNNNNIHFSLYSNFKGPLTEGNGLEAINDENREQFGKYICEIYSNIISNNRDLKPDPNNCNFVVYIACPSGWNEEQVVAYKDFVRNLNTRHGRIPLADIVRESDAAYVHVRKTDKLLENCGTEPIENCGTEPKVLVIDYGSSTIDFTWFGGDIPIHDGKPLGASCVEKILFDYMYNHEKCAKLAFKEALKKCQRLSRGDLEKIVVYALREVKEIFYNQLLEDGDNENFAQINSIPLAYWIQQANGLTFGFDNPNQTYDRIKMRDILNSKDECLAKEKPNGEGYYYDNRSYIDRVKNAFEDFNNKSEVTGVDYVILTGGASCMDFVDELVSEVYHVSKKNNTLIEDGQDRSFSISRGVATWGYFHYRSSPIIDKIHRKLEENWGIVYDSQKKEYTTEQGVELLITDKKNNKTLIELIKDKVLELYKTGFNNLCNVWTSTQNNIKLNKEHNLNKWLTKILEDVEKRGMSTLTQKQLRRYQQIKYSSTQTLFDGYQSFHALFRKIFDYIEGDLSKLLNEELNKFLSARVNEEIGELLDNYWSIYFNEDKENPIQLNLDFTIELNIGDEQKKSLLWKLIEDTFDTIDSRRGTWLSSGDLTFNHNRDYDDSMGIDGRKHFDNILITVANDFAASIKPTYPNLKKQLNDCQNQIAKQFTALRYQCERSVYQIH